MQEEEKIRGGKMMDHAGISDYARQRHQEFQFPENRSQNRNLIQEIQGPRRSGIRRDEFNVNLFAR
jgi:hypothetical protein